MNNDRRVRDTSLDEGRKEDLKGRQRQCMVLEQGSEEGGGVLLLGLLSDLSDDLMMAALPESRMISKSAATKRRMVIHTDQEKIL